MCNCPTVSSKGQPFTSWLCLTNWFDSLTVFDFESYFVGPIHAVRTILLIMLVQACDGVWALEQPGSSTLEFYPAWLTLMTSHYKMFGCPATQTQSMCIIGSTAFRPLPPRTAKHYSIFALLNCPGEQSALVDVSLRGDQREAPICLFKLGCNQAIGRWVEKDVSSESANYYHLQES